MCVHVQCNLQLERESVLHVFHTSLAKMFMQSCMMFFGASKYHKPGCKNLSIHENFKSCEILTTTVGSVEVKFSVG